MTIKLKNIELSYRDGESMNTILHDVNLYAEVGRITGLIGPSGSGKSSILTIAGLLNNPSKGEIVLNGMDVTNYSRNEKTLYRRDNIGIIFQSNNLIPSLTALDQLLLMNHLGKGQKEDKRKAYDLLDQVGLAGEAHKRPAQLSGGQKQRINIARAFMNNPKILLVDEATSALDTKRGDQILEIIKNFTREYNTTTLMVTHNKAHLPLMDKVYNIVDGFCTIHD